MTTHVKTLADSTTGLKFTESPRWHNGKLWFLDIHDKRIKTVDLLAREADPRRALDRLRTADSILCPAQYLATQLAAAGRATWMYHFTRVREGDVAARRRAYHGAELPYVFGTHDAWLPTGAADRALSATMMDYWVAFARDGDPNHAGAAPWPAWRAPDHRVLQLDVQIRSVPRPEAALCAMWEQAIERGAIDVAR